MVAMCEHLSSRRLGRWQLGRSGSRRAAERAGAVGTPGAGAPRTGFRGFGFAIDDTAVSWVGVGYRNDLSRDLNARCGT